MILVLKKLNLKDVSYLIIQAWNEVPKSVIQSSFKHLFNSVDEIQFNLFADHFTEEDDIPLGRLYNSILNESSLTDIEIMEWAIGENENNIPLNDSNIFENSVGNEQENNNDDINEINTHINTVIDSFNVTIEWADDNNFPINETLLLRRMREKAVLKKFD